MSNIVEIVERLSAYAREVKFVIRNSHDWKTVITLLKYTLLFHASNIRRDKAASNSPFSVIVRLASGRTAGIVIRPFAGDIFILFEVLMERCYHVPDAILAPEAVEVILDCGANIGLTALYFAARYPNARIFSIEPNEENFEILKRNTSAEPRIVPIRGAVVGRPRQFVRLTSHKPAWGNFISDNDEGHEVPAFTIEQILRDHNLPHVDLLKVDIEGEEKHVFGEGQFMRYVSHVIIELHGDYDFSGFSTDVARFNFQAIAPDNGSDFKMIMARPFNSIKFAPVLSPR
jgi:FkbM family methyltransferase